MAMSSFVAQQRKLKLQMQTLQQLEDEFLKQLWSNTPRSTSDLQVRDDRLMSLLESAGDLPPVLVLRLFYSLEYKAQREITKPVLAAQTTNPDCLASELPAQLIANMHAAHQEAFTSRQSEQCSRAGKHKRLERRHDSRGKVEARLQEWLDDGRLVPGRRGHKAAFVEHILDDYPLGIKRSQTVYKWLTEYLTENT